LDARAEHGGGKVAVVDADGRTMTYDQLILAAFALGSALKKGTQKGEKIGVLLPTGVGVLVTFFGLHAYGRVPAMLNFTSGVANLRTAARTAPFTKIITARQFIEIGKLDDLIMGLKDHVEIIYLEDIRPKLNIVDKLRGAVGSQLGWLVRSFPSPDEPGVVLFTSGTEGTPKGVVLSHANVVANVEQVRAHVALRTDDVVFNPLPTFHCFGLTGGALLPLFAGMKAVLHPSPLQFKVIPKRIRETGSTILFATDTFLSQYARAGDQGDMNNLRFTVCGAERVRDETRQLVRTKYNMDVLEGYGATEAAPVLAVNQPENNRPGTVGQLLPGIEHKLIPVEGIAEGGRLVVRGPNVMQGYILAEQPGVIQPPQDGWHDTGDVVTLDAEGYVTIRGRVKRFAKIGGEMVSLAVVENCAAAIWPDNMHAAVAIPDTRKGEQIVLLTDSAVANRQEILAWAQSHGVPELAVPRKVFFSDGIPVLGTGKIDYSMVTRLALAAKEQPEPLAS
jgi:acyl-[acyl-carrier-protein]-phospholipid O-acyltransferase/long-chain-fatty-acid--[acyl-carrier-protein] ligase